MRGYDPSKPASAFTAAPCAMALSNDFPGEIKQDLVGQQFLHRVLFSPAQG
jgi:hypothetical protein